MDDDRTSAKVPTQELKHDKLDQTAAKDLRMTIERQPVTSLPLKASWSDCNSSPERAMQFTANWCAHVAHEVALTCSISSGGELQASESNFQACARHNLAAERRSAPLIKQWRMPLPLQLANPALLTLRVNLSCLRSTLAPYPFASSLYSAF